MEKITLAGEIKTPPTYGVKKSTPHITGAVAAMTLCVLFSACKKEDSAYTRGAGPKTPLITDKGENGSHSTPPKELAEKERLVEELEKIRDGLNDVLEIENKKLKELMKSNGIVTEASQPGDLWSLDPATFKQAVREQINTDGSINLDPQWGWETPDDEDLKKIKEDPSRAPKKVGVYREF